MVTLRLALVSALACGIVAGVPCSVARAAEGDVTFGSQWWDQSAPDAKYHEFSQVPRGGFIESFLLREWSGRNSVALWGANTIRKDQAAKLTWANGARWRMDLGYAEIPHSFSDVARWGWTQGAAGVFGLPDSLQARNQALPSSYTQRMTDFLKSAPGIGLGFNTNVSSARLRARPAMGWQFEARSALRNRSGLKPYAIDFGFSTALENPEPVNQRMVDADFIASYQRARFSAQAGVGLSSFTNRVSTLIVDNPKRITDVSGGDGPKAGALDLYPDNRVVRGSAALSYLLSKSTAFAATIGIAHGTQDDPFLPFTSNSALPQSSLDSLPARQLDAKSVQMNGDVRLTTRPTKSLDGTLRFNYTDYDNQTEELNFIGQAPYDVSWQRYIEMPNHILSNTQWRAGVDLGYALTSRVKLGAIAELRVRERTAREIEKDDETILGGKVRLRLMDGFAAAAEYTRGDRSSDEFLLEDYSGFKTRTASGSTAGLYDSVGVLEQPGLRRFDVADRVQDRATADVSYALGERVDLSVNYAFLRSEFGSDTTLGLQDEELQTVASSATFHVSEKLDLTGGYGLGLTETNQISRASGAIMTFRPDSNWTAKLNDEEVFFFAGVDWAAGSKVSFGVDFQSSRTISEFDLGNGLNNAADLPKTKYRRHNLVLDARWRWLENTTLIGRWAWEGYDIEDWATTDVPLIFPVTGTANAIFLGDSSQSYHANRLALVVKHTF
jgi:MtrB/PioB family decaheme-associated outer membrane protein